MPGARGLCQFIKWHKGVPRRPKARYDSKVIKGEPMANKTFIVRYPVTTYVAVEVERDENITQEALLDSVTRQDLVNGETQDDCAWDTLKDSWREGIAEVYTYDAEGLYEDAFDF